MNLPYGMGDFGMLRRGRYHYVDKTRFIPRLEDPQRGRRHVLFLRPRRFGKTLLLSMLQRYYDLRHKDAFDELFAGLYIAAHPTAERSMYLVLRLDFAGLATTRGIAVLQADFTIQLRSTIERFLTSYQDLLAAQILAWRALPLDTMEAAALMAALVDLIAVTPYQIYLFIDEHDNFANDLIAQGREDVYGEALHASGFVREFYKRVKTGADGGVIARIFMTGVTPLMVNDMTSGFNIAKNVSDRHDLADLCGFAESDVREMLNEIIAAQGLSLDAEQTLLDLRRYYNGYQFSPEGGRVYNPAMVLYFLSELVPPDRYPRQLLDPNVRSDSNRLARLLFTSSGAPRPGPVHKIQALLSEGSTLDHVDDLFRLDEAYDDRYFASFLYYLGLLTMEGEEGLRLRLRIPNVVIAETYGDVFRRVLERAEHLGDHEDTVRRHLSAMAFRGDIAPLLGFLYEQVISKLSNRDLIKMDERALKMLLLAYLSPTDVLLPFSEMEIGRGYGDLVLILNRSFATQGTSYLLELKYVKESAEPPSGLRAKRRRRKDAAALGVEVEERLREAEAQLRRYLTDPRLCGVQGPNGWKAVAVVQVGTQALLFRELDQPTQRIPRHLPLPRCVGRQDGESCALRFSLQVRVPCFVSFNTNYLEIDCSVLTQDGHVLRRGVARISRTLSEGEVVVGPPLILFTADLKAGVVTIECSRAQAPPRRRALRFNGPPGSRRRSGATA